MKKVLLGLAAVSSIGIVLAQSSNFVPERIKKAGEIVYCTEVGYPPFEFFPEGSKNPAGFDIDLGNELAKRLGVKSRWENVNFDGIIASLQTKKCDAIIAGLGATDRRKEQVNFVLYLANNRALVVRKGNPKKVTGYDSLCGLAVGAQVGSANYDDMARLENKCKADNKPAMTLRSFKDNAALRLALLTNQIDVYNTSAANAAVEVAANADQLEIGAVSDVVNFIGIALRKDDPSLRIALDRQVKLMHRDGTMDRLLKTWNLTPFRLKNP